MKIEQIYTGCLAQGAYYIESEGEAVVIDPLREVQPYLDRAEKSGAKIKYILETHFHADFVSGHLDLAKKSGGTIVYGPTAKPDFDSYIAKDNEVLKVGKITITVLHTPGHTMESTCYLLKDENGKNTAIFTGDTLFIGDVGRPDLAQKVSSDLTQEKLAGYLYHSLRNKIMPLEDDIIVYPAHGAGSACGKNMSKETFDTLGNQKKTNYALQEMTEQQFIKEVTDGLLPPPAYFPENVMMNIKGYESLDVVMNRGMNALSPEKFEEVANQNDALILDTRNAQVFSEGFIPNAINIGVDGGFAPWVGTLILDIKQPILLITDLGREEEVITRLSRVGYDNVLGYLEGGFDSWKNSGKETDSVRRISAQEFESELKQNKNRVLDVRKEGEFEGEHLEVAENLPLAYINNWISVIDDSEHFYLHCAGGYRSMMAASILNSRGIRNFTEIGGGYGAIKNTSLAKTNFVCPSTVK
ncbi:MAG: MBL fold metallo-hydrolase [Flavobacteriaceae bacterium]